MSSTTTFDGIRGVNAFYHSVIEEVTGHLQTLLDEEKEEERKRIRKILENRLKDERGKAAEKKPARKGSKNRSSEINAGAKAEVKRLEALLKKPAEKLFMPDVVISGCVRVYRIVRLLKPDFLISDRLGCCVSCYSCGGSLDTGRCNRRSVIVAEELPTTS